MAESASPPTSIRPPRQMQPYVDKLRPLKVTLRERFQTLGLFLRAAATTTSQGLLSSVRIPPSWLTLIQEAWTLPPCQEGRLMIPRFCQKSLEIPCWPENRRRKAQHGQKKRFESPPFRDMMEILSLKTFYWHSVNKI